MRAPRLPAMALLLAALAAGTPAGAQVVQVVGTVLEENSSTPIAGARVEVYDVGWRSRGVAVTGADGRFTLRLREQPGYRVRATRAGYRTNNTPVLWTDGHDFLQIELRLDRNSVLLAPIEIVARSRRQPSAVLASFRSRLRTGMGQYITRDDIEKRHPPAVTDLLATVPGVRLESSGTGFRRTVYLTRAIAGPRDCPAQIFIDGFPLQRGNPFTNVDPGFAIDDVVSPDAIEGIEIYRGLSTVPAEFLTPNAHCGVVAIWTRRGNA